MARQLEIDFISEQTQNDDQSYASNDLFDTGNVTTMNMDRASVVTAKVTAYQNDDKNDIFAE